MADEDIEEVVITQENDGDVVVTEDEEVTAVVDNGQTYESTESAIIAKEEADRAKLWAQESERQANISTRGAEEAGQAKDDAISAKEDAQNSAENAQNSAEVAEFYAKNVKFGMVKELFSVSDWIQENNIYYIEYNYNIVSGVYKLNQTNYELMTNIDVKDLGDKVRIYSIERFAGFVLLVNSAENSVRWGDILGTLSAQTDLQNALNLKANVSDIPTNISDLYNDIGYITGITSGDVITALGYTPYDITNPDGYITSSALVGYATENYVTTAVSSKQDKLIAGTGISIVGNVISSTQTSAEWGNIGGTLSAQTDLQNALNAKANITDIPTATSDLTNDSGFITASALNGYATQTWVGQQGYITSSALAPYVLSSSLATVATSGDYDDLLNKPTIPSAVTEATVSGWGFTKNTGTVTSVNNISPVNGNVTLSIPTVNNPTITFTQGGTTKGTITLNQASNQTINFDAGGGGSYTAGDGIIIENNEISVDGVQTNTIDVYTKTEIDNMIGDIETTINTIRGV